MLKIIVEKRKVVRGIGDGKEVEMGWKKGEGRWGLGVWGVV